MDKSTDVSADNANNSIDGLPIMAFPANPMHVVSPTVSRMSCSSSSHHNKSNSVLAERSHSPQTMANLLTEDIEHRQTSSSSFVASASLGDSFGLNSSGWSPERKTDATAPTIKSPKPGCAQRSTRLRHQHANTSLLSMSQSWVQSNERHALSQNDTNLLSNSQQESQREQKQQQEQQQLLNRSEQQDAARQRRRSKAEDGIEELIEFFERVQPEQKETT